MKAAPATPAVCRARANLSAGVRLLTRSPRAAAGWFIPPISYHPEPMHQIRVSWFTPGLGAQESGRGPSRRSRNDWSRVTGSLPGAGGSPQRIIFSWLKNDNQLISGISLASPRIQLIELAAKPTILPIRTPVALRLGTGAEELTDRSKDDQAGPKPITVWPSVISGRNFTGSPILSESIGMSTILPSSETPSASLTTATA